MNTASPSGMLGESISLAILFPAFPFLRYMRNVAVWPTTCPPIGLVGSPKNASGLDATWLVTAMTALLTVAKFRRSCG